MASIRNLNCVPCGQENSSQAFMGKADDLKQNVNLNVQSIRLAGTFPRRKWREFSNGCQADSLQCLNGAVATTSVDAAHQRISKRPNSAEESSNMKHFQQFGQAEDGLELAEYALAAALIAIAVVLAFQSLGGSIVGALQALAAILSVS